MRYAPLFLVVGIALVSSSGCGTVLNFASGDPEVYGGVKQDAEILRMLYNTTSNNTDGGGKKAAVCLALLFTDFPLSTMGDTITLPFTLFREPKIPSEDRSSPTFLPQYSYGAIAAPPASFSVVEPVALFLPRTQAASISVSATPTDSRQGTNEGTTDSSADPDDEEEVSSGDKDQAISFPLKDIPFFSPAPALLSAPPASPP
jgi:uncharacterized protein YceK